MIAKSTWFSPRKYTGWGLTPNCWQGWAYIALVAAPLFLIQFLNLPGSWSAIVLLVWSALFAIDIADTMFRVKRDERESLHEALAERNAMWFMVASLGVGIAFQAATSVATKSTQVDPVIIIALLGSLAVKAATHFYLRDK